MIPAPLTPNALTRDALAPDALAPDRHLPQVLRFPALALVPSGQAVPRAHPDAAVCFTVQDRMALLSWHHAGSGGYARLVIEDGRPGATPDRGAFALAYRPGQAFAAFGLTRTPAGIQVWRCADGEVLGLHRTMDTALAALPPG